MGTISVYEMIDRNLLKSTPISTQTLYFSCKQNHGLTCSLETFAKTFRDYRRLYPDKVIETWRDNTSNSGKHKVYIKGE